jgi:allantoinase
LLPGIIDPHVHLNEPGRTDWEGFETGTKAALAGGVTTLVDMPLNSDPVTTTAEAFDKKLLATEKKLFTNSGFWGGVVPGNASSIQPLADKGVLGFKVFLTHSGIDDFPNVVETDLHKAMPLIARLNLPLLVHCELPSAAPVATDHRSYSQYLASRPRKWEDEAIAMMIRLCEQYSCRVHIVHLSSAASIEAISDAKNRGLPITVETSQHYLHFNAEEIADGQTEYKCAPPIREKENNERLWQALESGVIDFVATDHSPAPPTLKARATGDFTTAWGGIASLQFSFPALWTPAKKRGISLSTITRWLSLHPARLIGHEGKKGQIAKGFDADLTVVDTEKNFLVQEAGIHHKHKLTPYLHKQLFGLVRQTWLKGKKVYENAGSESFLREGTVLLNVKK